MAVSRYVRDSMHLSSEHYLQMLSCVRDTDRNELWAPTFGLVFKKYRFKPETYLIIIMKSACNVM